MNDDEGHDDEGVTNVSNLKAVVPTTCMSFF